MAFTDSYKKHWIIYTSLIVLFVTAAVVVPTTVLLIRNDDSNNVYRVGSSSLQVPKNTTSQMLSTDNTLFNLSSWNIVRYVYGKENWNSVDNQTAKVVYTEQSVNPSSTQPGGFVFYVSPKDRFPTDEVYLSYSVYFGDNAKSNRKLLTNQFDWVKGGMLPGLCIGKMGAQDAKHLEDGASCRIMWRPKGKAEAYLYVSKQTHEFKNLPGYFNNEPYGESIYRGFTSFVLGEWNDIIMRVKLNTVGQNNGILQLSINGKTVTYDKMVWRNTPDMLINGIAMHSFFGGSDKSWATPTQQSIYFSKFTVYSL